MRTRWLAKKPPSVNNLTMAGSVCSTSTSTYLSTLSSADRQRYDLKLQGSGFKFQDPYSIDKSEWNSDLSFWPDISFGDIWTYLVLTPGVYTAENMKAYKSLGGYNFFTCGKVMPVLYYTNEESVACILRSTVQPSQSHLNDKKSWHHPWVLVNKSTGSIIAAHCTCKAG